MAGAYVVTASLWKDPQGVRHRRGDRIDPPEGAIERLLRARAITLAEDESDTQPDDPDATAKAETEREAAEKEAAVKAEAERQAALQAQGKASAPRPKAAATEPAWEKYAALRGIDTTGLGKDQLIAAVDKLDAK